MGVGVDKVFCMVFVSVFEVAANVPMLIPSTLVLALKGDTDFAGVDGNTVSGDDSICALVRALALALYLILSVLLS